MEYKSYFRCKCGAISLMTYDGRTFSCHEKNMDRFFHGVDLSVLEELPTTFSCDWCVNHYGLDLCACGSGVDYEDCDNGLDCCNRPMQSIHDGYTNVYADDAIGGIRFGSVFESQLVAKNGPSAASLAVQEALQMEKQVKEVGQRVISAIADEINRTEVPGVRKLDSTVNCFIVSFSAIKESRGLNFSPMFYSSKVQADLIRQALEAAAESGGLTRLIMKLQEITSKKSVVIAKQSYQLNDVTVNILEKACSDCMLGGNMYEGKES